MLVSWTGSAGKLKMIGRDSVNRQHHPTQSTTTYRVNSGGRRHNNIVLDISYNNFCSLMATINYHLESTWLPHGYHMVTAWLSLGY